MTKSNIKDIKKLREETGAGVLDVKKALEEFDGDVEKAKEKLLEKAKEKAATKGDRETGDGLVYSYIHTGGKAGSMILMACETDFVAKTEDFQNLCKEVAMQACTADYESVDELLDAEYIRDDSKKVKDLITEAIAKLGENITLKKFVKYSIK